MLESRSLCYQLGTKSLIDCISLRFTPGILYGILGPNGSGKSTLLKNLSGIWQPTHGSVLWKEQDLLSQKRQEISRTISLVSQNPQIHFDFTVQELVFMGRYPHRNSGSKDSEIIEWALQTVDAWHLRKRPITQLSQGERQRVFIARALVTESPILLLDEPTASLDIRHQLEIWKLLRELVEHGKLIIVANHDLTATQQFCDQVAVLNHGRCVGEGVYSEVMTDERIEEVFGVKRSQLVNVF